MADSGTILIVPQFWLPQATVKNIVVCSSWENNYILIIFDEAMVALSLPLNMAMAQ